MRLEVIMPSTDTPGDAHHTQQHERLPICLMRLLATTGRDSRRDVAIPFE